MFSKTAQTQHKRFELENLSQKNGLPSNETYFIFRDSKEYLWIATDQGVIRYNGAVIDRFNLPDNVIFKIREDNKGRIWFFSFTGKLAYFYKGIIYPYKYNHLITSRLNGILIMDAFVNDMDDVIISGKYQNCKISAAGVLEIVNSTSTKSSDSTIYEITKMSKSYYFTQQISFNSHSDSVFIKLSANNKTWRYTIPCSLDRIPLQYSCVSNNGKEFYFNAGNKIIKFTDDGHYTIKEFSFNVISLYTIEENKIWAGFSKSGAMLLNSDLSISTTQLLTDKTITCITTDYEGGTWFATLEKGAYYLKNINLYNLGGDINLDQSISRVCNYHDSILLFANSEGVYKYENSSVTPVFLHKNEILYDLLTDDRNNIYLAGRSANEGNPEYGQVESMRSMFKNAAILQSTSELFEISRNTYLFHRGTRLAKADFNNDIFKQKSKVFPLEIHKLTIRPTAFYIDQQSQIWLGSIYKMYKHDLQKDQLIIFKDSNALFDLGINAIRQMDNKLYMIAIRSGGIVVMKDTTILGHITEEDGLLSNSIKYLMPQQDRLWVVTSKGISVISFKSYLPLRYTINSIGENAGFYDLIVNQIIPFRNNIVAATNRGLFIIQRPEQFLSASKQTIHFHISNINYYKGDTTGISHISLPYQNNRLKIRYNAVCFNSPDDVKYFYRFKLKDTTWRPISGTELLLENLAPGNYKLQLKASIPNQHRFSEIRTLDIIMEKPWWKNNWLRLMMLVFITGVGYVLYKSRINQIRKKERVKGIAKTRIIELEQTALRSQMNSHFIFNCLTSIQQLILFGNKDEANDNLVKFARLIRKTLEISANPYILLAEEKLYLSEYLFLEQLRMPGQLEFQIVIDDAIDVNHTQIPNMMLQPIVENCIRHGIKHLENKIGLITIAISRNLDQVVCKVTDNGVGRKKRNESEHPEIQKSYGIDIVSKRLELLTQNKDYHFTIEIIDMEDAAGSPAGTQVIIQLPFKMMQT